MSLRCVWCGQDRGKWRFAPRSRAKRGMMPEALWRPGVHVDVGRCFRKIASSCHRHNAWLASQSMTPPNLKNCLQRWMIGPMSNASLVPQPVAVDEAGTPKSTKTDLFSDTVFAQSSQGGKLKVSLEDKRAKGRPQPIRMHWLLSGFLGRRLV